MSCHAYQARQKQNQKKEERNRGSLLKENRAERIWSAISSDSSFEEKLPFSNLDYLEEPSKKLVASTDWKEGFLMTIKKGFRASEPSPHRELFLLDNDKLENSPIESAEKF